LGQVDKLGAVDRGWLRQFRIAEGEMSATLHATSFVSKKEATTAEERLKAAAKRLLPIALPAKTPTLQIVPLLRENQPRRFVRVPTHAVGVHPEHREYPRAALKLPLKLRGVDSVRETFPVTLVTRDVSSTGVYFLCPRQLPVGASLELEIVLISRPLGRGNVVVTSMAHVQRVEPAAMPKWYGIAASFDDMEFDRDDGIPIRFV
jgi:hypothetical protein